MTDVDALRFDLLTELGKMGTASKAAQMKAYMKDIMDFQGVPMPTVRLISKELAEKYKPASSSEWQAACLSIWRQAKVREELYFCETWTGLRVAKPWQTPALIPMYEEMLVSGAWWDIVDWIATNRIGDILMNHRDDVAPILRGWSTSDNMWKRRTAILSQNRHKAKTDVDFLFEMIAPSIESKEFFLRKAIGWSLRDLAKTRPDVVKAYVKANESKLSGLSKREALKHL
ncbi:MAG: DNA alkylation repair protein [Deltaproteobacteria bacterium]|nr:DNA alkylation repair protein [Deltaproteobacteria bacterium]